MDKKEASLVPHICRYDDTSSSESSEDDSSTENDDLSLYINNLTNNTCESKNIKFSKKSQNYKKKQSKWSTYWSRYKRFVDSPRVHFTYDSIFYLVFLTLFSYVILCEFSYYEEIDEFQNEYTSITSIESLFDSCVQAIILLKCLRLTGYFGTEITDHGYYGILHFFPTNTKRFLTNRIISE